MGQTSAIHVETGGVGDELHSAIDAFASVLGAMSAASSTDIGSARLAAWQRHLLVLEPPPGVADGAAVTHRVWGGARGAAVGWVDEEAGERLRRNTELQDTLWALVKGISETLRAEAASDAEAAACLDRLREAGSLSPDDLRAAVTEAVVRIAEILERRRLEHEQTAMSLAQRIHALSSDLESARREADLDPLTQLANRGVFDRELERGVDLQALTGDPTTLVLIDVDHFKQINDELGHRIGDDVLRAVANELVRAFPRRSDLVARYGGDEFAVLLLNAGIRDAERLAGRLMERLGSLDVVTTPPVRVSVTIGIAALGRDRSVQGVLDAADRALYRAKSAGRGCACVDEHDAASAAAS